MPFGENLVLEKTPAKSALPGGHSKSKNGGKQAGTKTSSITNTRETKEGAFKRHRII